MTAEAMEATAAMPASDSCPSPALTVESGTPSPGLSGGGSLPRSKSLPEVLPVWASQAGHEANRERE
jgi:hypothetical protein